MTIISRVLTAVAALGLIVAIYQPIWRIDLTAPQYPEGLYMNIWADKLGGDVAVINGLNHYIGMKTLHEEEFVEFKVLPYIIWALAGLGLLTVVLNRRKIFYAYFGLFILFAVVAMADFYRWEYDYGHDLDPNAPIQVPGQAYQPPLIGYKQLLNFSAYSIPDKGGWAFIGSGVLLLGAVIAEKVKQRRLKKIVTGSKPAGLAAPAIAATALLFSSCASGPEAIRFGKDGCDHCKMTIMDKKFGGEIVTEKGKIFRFDDISCMADYYNSGNLDKSGCSFYFLDYFGTGNLLDSTAVLVYSEELRSPMGGNYAAVKDAAGKQKLVSEMNATIVSWNDIAR